MQKILFLLRQRRVWATIVGIAGFICSLYGINFNSELVINNLTEIGVGISSLFSALLALWSILKPKKND